MLLYNRKFLSNEAFGPHKVLPKEFRVATAGKAPKAWGLPRFWVPIHSYKKQLVKTIGGRILGLTCLKFAVTPLGMMHFSNV